MPKNSPPNTANHISATSPENPEIESPAQAKSSAVLSHQFSRVFKPEKTHPPRGFVKPELKPSMTYRLEIGAGKGRHALLFAQNHPDDVLFSVERTKDKFGAFAKLVEKAACANLHAIHADAVAWAVHALPPESLAGVFVLYPNPEPHNPNQRWHNMPFFEFLLSRMQPRATLVLASNVATYIAEAHKQLGEVWCLPVEKTVVPKMSARTHFEVKYLARGEACWQLTAVKPSGYKTRFDDWCD